MRKLALAAMAAVVVGMLVTTIPASAQRFGGGVHLNPGIDRGGGIGWNNNRYYNRWGGAGLNNRYYNRWGAGYRPYGWGLGAGVIGYGAGAALANQRYVNQNIVTVDEHVALCEARYRSYNPETDMFLGFDGAYHRCNP
jgi:hypothetical protein